MTLWLTNSQQGEIVRGRECDPDSGGCITYAQLPVSASPHCACLPATRKQQQQHISAASCVCSTCSAVPQGNLGPRRRRKEEITQTRMSFSPLCHDLHMQRSLAYSEWWLPVCIFFPRSGLWKRLPQQFGMHFSQVPNEVSKHNQRNDEVKEACACRRRLMRRSGVHSESKCVSEIGNEWLC